MLGQLHIYRSEVDLDSVLHFTRILIDRQRDHESLLVKGWAYMLIGWTEYLRDELDLAAQAYGRGVEIGDAINAKAAIDCYCGLALSLQAQDRSDEAIQVAEDLRRFVSATAPAGASIVARALTLRLEVGSEELRGRFRTPLACPTGALFQTRSADSRRHGSSPCARRNSGVSGQWRS